MQVDELERIQTPEACFIASELVVAKSEISKIGKKDNLVWDFTLEEVQEEINTRDSS